MLAAKTRKQRLRISLSVNTYGQEFYFLSSGPNGSFFQYWAASGQLLKKEDWVAGGFYSGRNVEVFYQIFPGTLSTLGYFGMFRVFLGVPDISGFRKYGVS